MIQSPELQAKIQSWRARSAGQGEPMTIADWTECFRILRQERSGAQAASAASKSRKAAPKAPIDTSSLKDKLKGLAALKKP